MFSASCEAETRHNNSVGDLGPGCARAWSAEIARDAAQRGPVVFTSTVAIPCAVYVPVFAGLLEAAAALVAAVTETAAKHGACVTNYTEVMSMIFDDKGKVTRKAKFHVVHNGHVIHDNHELSGGTGWRGPHSISEYKKHGDKGPLKMQDHGNPVRFRNIWVVELED